jgi:hypothetical protein
MASRPKRETIDLSAYPDLVVIYLGMRVNTFRGIQTVLGFGPKISGAVDQKPDGLLLHENLFYSLRHVGMRQYWRDFESLEAWSHSEPHPSGGRLFCAIGPAPVSGTRRISCAAAWRLCISTCRRWAWARSPRSKRRAAPCFRPANGPAKRAPRPEWKAFRKATCTGRAGQRTDFAALCRLTWRSRVAIWPLLAVTMISAWIAVAEPAAASSETAANWEYF